MTPKLLNKELLLKHIDDMIAGFAEGGTDDGKGNGFGGIRSRHCSWSLGGRCGGAQGAPRPLNERHVRFTATAQRHVRREKAWWIEHRIHTEVFATELESALKIAALLPGADTPYLEMDVRDLRRLYLPKVACHIYYTFDEEEAVMRALWGARRGRGPQIKP